MELFTRGYALIIGVGEYSNPAMNIPIAQQDAQGVSEALLNPTIGSYERGRVQTLFGGEATSNRIDEEIKNLGRQLQPDDTLLLSFSGHGGLGEDNLYYLASSDAEFTSENTIRKNSGYSIADLARALRECKAQKILLIINACFAGQLGQLATSGFLAQPSALGTGLPQAASNSLLATGKGRALITASRPDERSYFQQGANYSHFGRALIQALKGQDVNPASGYIGLFELYSSIFTQVQRATQALGQAQHPQLHLVDGEGPFPVALYPQFAGQRDSAKLEQRILHTDVLRVTLNAPSASGDQSTAFVAEEGSTVTVDHSKVIDFGNAQTGDIRIGDVAKGDIYKTTEQTDPGQEDESDDPDHALAKSYRMISTAKHVDEDSRDDASNKIAQAQRALRQGDRAKAVQRIDEAIDILDRMGNGYINSQTRKLRNVRKQLSEQH